MSMRKSRETKYNKYGAATATDGKMFSLAVPEKILAPTVKIEGTGDQYKKVVTMR